MKTFIEVCVICLWIIGSPVAALFLKKAIMVFLCSVVLALPLMTFALVYDGPLDSAGIGQLFGAGLYGLIIFGIKRLFQWWGHKRVLTNDTKP